jgi:hypothetical protein
MRDDLQAQLYADFPHLFWERSLPTNQSSMRDGLCIGDGWEPILRWLCVSLSSIMVNDMGLDLASTQARQYAFTQVKEKFGGLRTYMRMTTPAMSNAVDQAEKFARRTCERCGAPGKLIQNPRGYLTTSCRNCAKAASNGRH